MQQETKWQTKAQIGKSENQRTTNVNKRYIRKKERVRNDIRTGTLFKRNEISIGIDVSSVLDFDFSLCSAPIRFLCRLISAFFYFFFIILVGIFKRCQSSPFANCWGNSNKFIHLFPAFLVYPAESGHFSFMAQFVTSFRFRRAYLIYFVFT